MVALLAGGILSFGSENKSYAQGGRGASTGRGSKITESSNSKTRSGESTDYNLSVKDLSGKEISLSQFKGKVIFMTFWATYCGFCRVELPSIQRLNVITAAHVADGFEKILSFQTAANLTKARVRKIYRQKVILF